MIYAVRIPTAAHLVGAADNLARDQLRSLGRCYCTTRFRQTARCKATVAQPREAVGAHWHSAEGRCVEHVLTLVRAHGALEARIHGKLGLRQKAAPPRCVGDLLRRARNVG